MRQLFIQKLYFIQKPYLIMLLAVFLSACQTVPERSLDNGEWLTDEVFFVQRQIDFESQEKWEYSARVGVVTSEHNEQANIVWASNNQVNNVRLFGPLGVGQVKLDFDQDSVQLSDRSGVLHHGLTSQGDTAEKLLSNIVGLPIPLDALSYWMFVLPQPGAVYEYQVDEQNDLVGLKQLGWQIVYSDYRDYGGNLLPRRLTATKSDWGDRVEKVTVRLVTNDWKW